MKSLERIYKKKTVLTIRFLFCFCSSNFCFKNILCAKIIVYHRIESCYTQSTKPPNDRSSNRLYFIFKIVVKIIEDFQWSGQLYSIYSNISHISKSNPSLCSYCIRTIHTFDCPRLWRNSTIRVRFVCSPFSASPIAYLYIYICCAHTKYLWPKHLTIYHNIWRLLYGKSVAFAKFTICLPWWMCVCVCEWVL